MRRGALKFAGGLLIQDVPTKGDDETIVALQDRLQELPPSHRSHVSRQISGRRLRSDL